MLSLMLAAFQLLLLPGFLKASENSAGVYVYQWKAECWYSSEWQDPVGVDKIYYNNEEVVEYDSRVGKFYAKSDLGKPTVEYWNNDTELLERRKAEVATVCKHNYDISKQAIVDRNVVPKVKISPTGNSGSIHSNMLVCFVSGFYPPSMNISWLKNGEEVTHDISSTGIIQNGDWTYQIHLTLELTPKAGEKYGCKVVHSSLREPLIVDWVPEETLSGKNKLITGIGGFVLGTIFIIVGLVVYLRNKKGQTRIPVPQSEGLMS
ncbi:H-2 class II histocompatibility antigen, E-S beta chain-like [Protopterus annectens]|uniref:H-2 class II histocompatibility antigen, E-S beta chain-like n=1 Tax=Protopterus annectens TaxID=7888 RepID=UPI001CFA5E6D|nr:H-2 class II histocompatibility antigen, E-S beta chain-like [Protopterus annectens]